MSSEWINLSAAVTEALIGLEFDHARHLVHAARAEHGDYFVVGALCAAGYPHENDGGAGLAVYTLLWTLLAEREEAIWHEAATGILSGPLMHEPQALVSAVFHARRACELEPGEARHWREIVSIGTLPTSDLSREELRHAASELIRLEPESPEWPAYLGSEDV